MRIRLAVASLCISISASDAAQLTGSLYLEKTTFARGEPVFLYWSLANKGPDTAEFLDMSDPDQPACSGVSITVSSDRFPIASCPLSRENIMDSSCSSDGPIRTRQVRPGKSYTERFLLNFHHDIAAAGDYWVDAKYGSISNGNQISNPEGNHAKISFRIDTQPIASDEWKPWLEQLKSPELEQRQEAARTLASVAPPSLEETLLGFARNAEFRKYSVLAFHQLNTPRSIEALAQLMEGPATNERHEAARYLAETNDQKWYPLLRDAAEKYAGDSLYVTTAAKLGGDKMLPLLVALEAGPARANAVMAMGYTRSRAAIPILIDELKNADINIGDRASHALKQLTHRAAIPESQNRDHQAEYVKWSRWWEREGAIAPIYSDSECAETVPLP